MNRRKWLAAMLALGFPGRSLLAQTRAPGRVRRIGWLTGGSPLSHAQLLEAFRAGLREHGWVEGQNIVIELRWAEGKLERLPALSAELVRLKPDVIVTAANVVHLAMKKETSIIPIVMMTGADPIAAGLVSSLARPDGNVTGLSGFFEATPIKMLELALALVPRNARIAVLLDANYSTQAMREKIRMDFERVVKSAGHRVEFIGVTTVNDVSRSLAALAKNSPAAVLVLPGSMIFSIAVDMVKSAEALKVPVIYPFEESVEAGGLMSYSAPLSESYRRAARYVDRILKGASPRELPIEQPTRLRLAVNMRTAKAHGIRIPREILVRADRLIE